jgi:hypothetical protein
MVRKNTAEQSFKESDKEKRRPADDEMADAVGLLLGYYQTEE